MNRIGIDLGGTKIEGVFLSQDNIILARTRIPTPQDTMLIKRIIQENTQAIKKLITST